MRKINSGKAGRISLLAYKKYFFFFVSFFFARIIGRDDRIIKKILRRNDRLFYKICSRVRRDINIVKGFWRSSRADFSYARIERNLGIDIEDSKAGISAAFFLRSLAALFDFVILEVIF
jgi:hypothetical protein